GFVNAGSSGDAPEARALRRRRQASTENARPVGMNISRNIEAESTSSPPFLTLGLRSRKQTVKNHTTTPISRVCQPTRKRTVALTQTQKVGQRTERLSVPVSKTVQRHLLNW